MNIEILLSFIIALSTVIYTIISLMLLCESKKTRQQKLNPIMIAYLKSTETHTMLELRIKNIGNGSAKDLSITILKDYNRLDKDNMKLSEIGIVKNGFNCFPPQYEMKYYINSLEEIDKKDINNSIKLKFKYKSIDNREFSEIFELPFNQVLNQNYSMPPETFIGQIPFYLKEINKALKSTKDINNNITD